jgi:hypothetical protein
MKRPNFLEELHSYCTALEKQNATLVQQNKELLARLQFLEEQFRLAQKRRFGPSSERTVPGQLQMIFNEIEAEAKPEEPEPKLQTIGTYKRKKTRRKRSVTLEGLPTEQIHYTLPEEAQVCPQCTNQLHEMSTQTSAELQVIPAQLKVIEHVQHIYACRHCEHSEVRTPIVTAPMPQRPISGSYASPSAIAYWWSRMRSGRSGGTTFGWTPIGSTNAQKATTNLLRRSPNETPQPKFELNSRETNLHRI